MFFIVSYADFLQMTPQMIQTIFATRHIVIEGVPDVEKDWSLETLSTIGNLTQPREIQGWSLNYMMKHGLIMIVKWGWTEAMRGLIQCLGLELSGICI
jgi:hypothetical protein